MVLSTLPGLKAGLSLCLAACERIKKKRAGQLLALVGPHFMSSYTCWMVSSLTGRSNQAL